MEATEETFQRSWKEKFPGVEAPRLSCFSEGTVSSIQQCYNETEQRLVALKEKVQREEFLKNYLWKLHRDCLNPDKGGQHPFAQIKLYSPTLDTRTDEEKFELDSPVPVVEIDPFDQKKEGLYKASSIDKLEPRSASNNSLNETREASSAEGNVRGKLDAPVTSRPSLVGGRRGKEVGESSNTPPAQTSAFAQGISAFGGIQGSVKDRLNRPGRFRKEGDSGGSGSSGGILAKITKLGSPKSEKRSTVHAGGQLSSENSNNNADSFPKTPLVKTYSEPGGSLDRNTTERLSQRNRPPVPLPRPSVKGPTFKNNSKQGSPGPPERKLDDRRGSEPALNSPAGMDGDMSSPARARKQKVHEYCEIEIASASSKDSYDSGGSAEDVNSAVGGGSDLTGSRIRRQALNRQRDYVNVTLPIKDNNQKSDTPVFPRESGPPMLRPRGKVDLCNTDSGSSASVSSKDDEDSNRLYDNPNRNTTHQEDDSSSEDDEPIYFNIMLLKKEALKNASLDSSTIYASIDLEKKGWEREKRRLSQGVISPYLTDADNRPPVPDKALIDDQPDKNHKKKSLKSTNSVDSTDSVFDDMPPAAGFRRPGEDQWKKRGSLRAALAEDNRSISSTSDDGEVQPNTGRTLESEKLQMRKWVMTSILDSEHSYIDMLDVLLQYMRSLQASAKSSQPVISEEEVTTIFFNIPDLHRIHSQFVQELEPIVENWTSESQVATVFKLLALEEYPLANEYCQNYQKARACLQRCSEENHQFHEIVKIIKCKGSSEVNTLEEMLHKPVVRVQRNTLVLHDLIKFTPTSHADYDLLQKTLKITQNFLDNFQTPNDPDHSEHQRYLVKNGIIVEMVSNRRKLRHVFLFNDVLVCAKQKLSRQKLHFECKWFIPLTELLLEASQSKEDTKMAAGQKDKVDKLKKRVSELQAELRVEVRKNRGQAEGRQWSMRGGRNLEKIRKKLTEQEVELFRESPNLVFRLRTKVEKKKPYTLLMSSDYERTDWRESIIGLQSKHTQGTPAQGLTNVDLQNLINSIQSSKINTIGAADDVAMEEEHVYGSLSVTVHKIQGLKAKADTFCWIEVDSYGHFSMKAKTNLICASSEPAWDEEFDIDLDGAQTLRLLAYKMNGDTDVLLGRGALELSKTWLKNKNQETTVSLNEEISLTLSLKYTSREQTLKRTPSSAKGGLFGVKISSVCKRESRQVPLIVSTCVEEVERRGLDDLGIYRISGLSSEIQRLKKAFERNVRGAIPLARETDTHVMACLLKLYLRELPEALFTDKLYSNFVEGLNLSDPEAKQRCMMSILRSLPEPNYTTIIYLMDHMLTISKHEDKNKMSIKNLATVFGPTLLRPAVTNNEPMSMDLFSAGARDAMLQTGILLYFLTLKDAGVDFSKH